VHSWLEQILSLHISNDSRFLRKLNPFMHSQTQFHKCKIVILPKILLSDLGDSCRKVKKVECVYYVFYMNLIYIFINLESLVNHGFIC
jgi:hypothetical protein